MAFIRTYLASEHKDGKFKQIETSPPEETTIEFH